MKYSILLIVALFSFSAHAKDTHLFLGFGEIPVLSSSFKPSIGVGKSFGSFELGAYYQTSDSLERGSESFNTEFGQNGLSSSNESVGQRAMIQAKYYPWKEYFYVSAGVIFNDNDVEDMKFSSQSRQIGNNTYNTNLNVKLTRPQAFRPGIGIGFVFPITKSIKFSTDFTMDWFTGVPNPEVEVNSSQALSEVDKSVLVQQVKDNFKSNFHNRHHLFNMGISYHF